MRSVNIIKDSNSVEVIGDFQPSENSMRVIHAIIGSHGSQATQVIAPYGTGKSYTALIANALLIGEDPIKNQAIYTLQNQFESSEERLLRQSKCKTILISQYCPNLAKELCLQMGTPIRKDLQSAWDVILESIRDYDRLAIIWDEFGHHLQTLIHQHKEEELILIQNLAEWAVRLKRPIVTFSVLMHKKLFDYNQSISVKALQEWKKVESRLETIRLETEPIDTLKIIANTINNEKTSKAEINFAKKVQSVGFFEQIDPTVLGPLLSKSKPLTPAAISALTVLAERLGQNDRTVSHFVNDRVIAQRVKQPIGLRILYDYFAPLLAGDISPEGGYKLYVEAENSLSKVSNNLEKELIKSLALLQVKKNSGKECIGKNKLIHSVCLGNSVTKIDTEKAFGNLIKNGILFYIKQTDEVRIWVGSGCDAASLIIEELEKQPTDLDCVSILNKLYPPEPVFSNEYNFNHSITRFANAIFVSLENLLDNAWLDFNKRQFHEADAVLLHVLESIPKKFDFQQLSKSLPRHWILSIADFVPNVDSLIYEIISITNLQERQDLQKEYPLLKEQLTLQKEVCQKGLFQELDKIQAIDLFNGVWFNNGKSFTACRGRDLDRFLNQIFNDRFPKTPIIHNEQVVRKNVSSRSISAIKRCCLSILERSGMIELGYQGSSAADASIFRSVFEQTGLYSSNINEGRWVQPIEINDQNLQAVWFEISEFFSKPKSTPVLFDCLLNKLTVPPYGIRPGLLPLLIASGLKAFGRSIAIYKVEDESMIYLDDIQPSTIISICSQPTQFSIAVASLTKSQKEILLQFVRFVSPEIDTQENDHFRAFYDGLREKLDALPASALEANELGVEATTLEQYLRNPQFDPYDFLLNTYPKSINSRRLTKRSLDKFQRDFTRMESARDTINQIAINEARRIFNQNLNQGNLPLLDVAQKWANIVGKNHAKVNGFNMQEKGLISRSMSAMKFPEGEHGYIGMLSTILVGKKPENWTSDDRRNFSFNLDQSLATIGNTILGQNDYHPEQRPLIKIHFAALIERFADKMGEEELQNLLTEIQTGRRVHENI